MGAISSAKVVYGLFGVATPAGTNVTGGLTVGTKQTTTSFSTADILYSFNLLSTGSSDVATLTISSGAVAQTTGTPTISDGDGNDFEGVALGTLSTSNMILVEPVGTSTGQFHIDSSSGTSGIDKYMEAAETTPLLCSFPASGTIAFTFTATADQFKITVLGQTA